MCCWAHCHVDSGDLYSSGYPTQIYRQRSRQNKGYFQCNLFRRRAENHSIISQHEFHSLHKVCPQLTLVIYEWRSKCTPDTLVLLCVPPCIGEINMPQKHLDVFSPIRLLPFHFWFASLFSILRYWRVWGKPRYLRWRPVYQHPRDVPVPVLRRFHVIWRYEDLPG